MERQERKKERQENKNQRTVRQIIVVAVKIPTVEEPVPRVVLHEREVGARLSVRRLDQGGGDDDDDREEHRGRRRMKKPRMHRRRGV